MNQLSLLPSERIIFALRSLYDAYGYSRYKMNKFEEYDLYARNKDFLISDGVITFTDMGGKLMALKPDVTLSIVKNTKDVPGVQKLYYNENVYRAPGGSRGFREIMQVGLEAIGDIDRYCIFEVLKLAAESLLQTQRNCVLEVSHMGILADVLTFAGIPSEDKSSVLRVIGEKNLHELQCICDNLGVSEEAVSLLHQLLNLSGPTRQVLDTLKDLLSCIAGKENLSEFVEIITLLDSTLPKGMLCIDFSAVSNPRYYNGFVFKGFAEGIPAGILSGGQYDTMMKEMKRRSKAIGFAVYLDLLEQYGHSPQPFDVDCLLLCSAEDSPAQIHAQAEILRNAGKSVRIEKTVPPELHYRQLLVMENGKVEEQEHA